MPKATPERTCIVTRETCPQPALLRFVFGPDHRVVFDEKGTLPGRGMWVKPHRHLVEESVKKNLFSRSAKQHLTADQSLVDQVELQLRTKALRYLGRAAAAGELLGGYEKIAAGLQKGELALLLHAEDAAEDGCRKLDKYAESIPVVRFGSRDELEEATKRPNPVHLGLKNGGIALAFHAAHDRWAGFNRADTL